MKAVVEDGEVEGVADGYCAAVNRGDPANKIEQVRWWLDLLT